MANEEQIDVLKQGVELWNRWVEDHPGVDIDLEGADLRESDFRNADFRNANLKEVNFRGADLSRAILFGANLSKANLIAAVLRETSLIKVDLRSADLSVADLRDTHLREANLSQANLTGACLIRARIMRAFLLGAELKSSDFASADLASADLSYASLYGANLTEANLHRANLTEANLMRANLTRTNLTKANLTRTNLTEGDLTNADFTNSEIGYTLFVGHDLSTTLGLEKIRHVGPSIISTDTIRKFRGKLPIEFLRGCGLSDLEIESAKLAAPGLDSEQAAQITYAIHQLYCNQPIQFYSCFISYNSEDHAFAQRLHNDLQNNGVRCWFAPEDLKIGDEFRSAIGKQIRVRDKLLIVLSKNSIRSEWVGDEVEKALAEEKEQSTLKLFPIRLDNAIFEARDDWAEKIRLRRHIGDFSTDYTRAFERLLRDLKSK